MGEKNKTPRYGRKGGKKKKVELHQKTRIPSPTRRRWRERARAAIELRRRPVSGNNNGDPRAALSTSRWNSDCLRNGKIKHAKHAVLYAYVCMCMEYMYTSTTCTCSTHIYTHLHVPAHSNNSHSHPQSARTDSPEQTHAPKPCRGISNSASRTPKTDQPNRISARARLCVCVTACLTCLSRLMHDHQRYLPPSHGAKTAVLVSPYHHAYIHVGGSRIRPVLTTRSTYLSQRLNAGRYWLIFHIRDYARVVYISSHPTPIPSHCLNLALPREQSLPPPPLAIESHSRVCP